MHFYRTRTLSRKGTHGRTWVGAHTEAPQPRDDCCSSSDEDEASQPAATTSESASTFDDCCENCLVVPRAGFALGSCRHVLLIVCYMGVSDMAAGCPVCRADITVIIGIFPR